MENNHKNNPSKKRYKDTIFKSQKETIFLYLQHNIATATMVSLATGIPHKNICRFKKDLQNNRKLWEVEKKPCVKTGCKAWYLSTNPKFAKPNNQLNLFD